MQNKDHHRHFSTLPRIVHIETPVEEAGLVEEDETGSAGKTGSYTIPKIDLNLVAGEQLAPVMKFDPSTGKQTPLFQVQGTHLRVPHQVFQGIQEYSTMYNFLAKPRTLRFLLTEGKVSLDIEMHGTVKTFHTNPIYASVIACFGDEEGRHKPQLTNLQVAHITNCKPELTQNAIRFWCIHGVLQYIGNNIYEAVA